MGYDVRITGSLTLPADKVEVAARALFAAAVELKKWGKGDLAAATPTAEGLKEAVNEGLSERVLYFRDVDDGSMYLEGDEDYVRREEEDEWILKALAPFLDDGELELEGGDGNRWLYRIKGGKFENVYGTTVYGIDAKAPEILAEIIKVLYPNGKPLSASEDCNGGQIVSAEHSACLSTLEELEDLIRNGGFGPQAGMSELDRMANV